MMEGRRGGRKGCLGAGKERLEARARVVAHCQDRENEAEKSLQTGKGGTKERRRAPSPLPTWVSGEGRGEGGINGAEVLP